MGRSQMVIGRTGDQLLTNEAGETTRYAQSGFVCALPSLLPSLRGGGDNSQGEHGRVIRAFVHEGTLAARLLPDSQLRSLTHASGLCAV
jgi:hypothetical protein